MTSSSIHVHIGKVSYLACGHLYANRGGLSPVDRKKVKFVEYEDLLRKVDVNERLHHHKSH